MLTKAIEWLGNKVKILDQTRLPQEEAYLELSHYQDIASAIMTMKVRGAGAIGILGAYGVALGALGLKTSAKDEFLKELQGIIRNLSATRPTAKSLFWAIDRMRKVTEVGEDVEEIKKALVAEAVKIHAEEVEATRKLSQLGSGLIRDGFTVLTHCNAGPIATTGYGTALGVIIRAKEQGKRIGVLATETRPLLQGARLTAWELKKASVPFTLITDSMAGYFMKRGEVSCAIVGADRIVRNGDTANKIGTYSLAVLARENKVPFYVAAPTTTVDLSLDSGDKIPIEQRSPAEVTHIQGVSIAPEGVQAANPAFDVTPHHYITAIITERGIARESFIDSLEAICR